MTDATSTPPSKPSSCMSVVPYALFVPVLVMMAASAWDVRQGTSLPRTLLAEVLADPFHPVIVCVIAVIAVISFFVIRPFASRATNRWVAFLACVLGFTILIESLLPKLAE